MGNFPKLPEGTKLQVGAHKATIVKYLSEGGFAHIYEVLIEPKVDDIEIACLKRVIVPDKSGLNQLRKEVEVMKVLRHARGIVRYFDSHAERLEDGTYQVLLLMELCPNKSLLEYMNARIKTKLNEPEIIKIMFDISMAIYEMHRVKLIHRDIKIENVLIDAKMHFKLCDFGSTSSFIMPPQDQQQFQMLSHDILYQTTPQYRAPEMIDLYRGYPINEKADIWALGCFLYKLCYYTTPFEVNGDIAILHASFQFMPQPLFLGDVKNLIIIMLQENPLFRPNIVQVLMLLAKMMNINFDDLGVEDYYKIGPYNFHGLQKYQQHKQNELLKQQQLFMQQQQLQQEQMYKQAYRVPESQPQKPQHLQHLQHLQTLQSLQNLHKPQSKTPATIESNSQSTTSGLPVSSSTSRTSLHSLSREDEKPERHESDAENDTYIDIESFNNVQERYPSVENLLHGDAKDPIEKITSKEEPFDEIASPKRPKVLSSSELHNLSPEELQDYNDRHELYRHQLRQHELTVQSKERENLERQASLSGSQTNLQRIEAWQRSKSSIDEDTGRLVDDIFSKDLAIPQYMNEDESLLLNEKENVEEGSQRNKNQKLQSEEEHSQIPKPQFERDQIQKSQLERETGFISSNPTESTNPFPMTNLDQDVKKNASFDRINVYPGVSEPNGEKNGDANPWGNYRRPPPSSVPSSKQPSFRLSEPVSYDLPDQFQGMRIDEKAPQNRNERNLIPNLIDVNDDDVPPQPPRRPEISKLKSDISREDVKTSPIYLGKNNTEGSAKDLVASLELDDNYFDLNLEPLKPESKTRFKKRLSKQIPSNFSLEEETVDFASDDESPENSSRMNRLSIRNSLKKQGRDKSRKSSDHKRSDSNGESKKRISLFGGNSAN